MPFGWLGKICLMWPCFAVLTKLGFRTSLYRAGKTKPNVDNMAKQGHIRHIVPSQQKPSHQFNVMLPHTIKKHITRYIKRYNKSQYFK